MKKTTVKIFLALAATLLAAGPAAASEQDDVMKTVRQWVESLNKGDVQGAIAACAAQTSILDEFPPYVWHGTGVCSKWAAELEVYNKNIGITDGLVTLRKPQRLDITGDHAYVVVPADYRFKQKGKDGEEIGALFSVGLRKGPAGWRITAWTWSRP